MVQPPVVINLTPAQRALIREASGKNIAKLGIEPAETGSGWLYSVKGNKFWLLKHPTPSLTKPLGGSSVRTLTRGRPNFA